MPEPMSEDRLAEIEAAVMPMVVIEKRAPTAAAENVLRTEWAGYRDELMAEVRRLRRKNLDLHVELRCANVRMNRTA